MAADQSKSLYYCPSPFSIFTLHLYPLTPATLLCSNPSTARPFKLISFYVSKMLSCIHTSREELIGWFVRLQLSDYEVSFHESQDSAWLDKVDRRYSWLRRTLMNYEEECMAIFPPEWGMEERISIQFCQSTRYSRVYTTLYPTLTHFLDLFAQVLLLYSMETTQELVGLAMYAW